jgi:hypothetical protein
LDLVGLISSQKIASECNLRRLTVGISGEIFRRTYLPLGLIKIADGQRKDALMRKQIELRVE